MRSVSWKVVNYRPQTKLRKGNVLTSVCQEFCPWGEGSVHPLTDTPRQIPPGRHTPGRHPLSRHPLADTPTKMQQTVRILLECILVLNETWNYEQYHLVPVAVRELLKRKPMLLKFEKKAEMQKHSNVKYWKK